MERIPELLEYVNMCLESKPLNTPTLSVSRAKMSELVSLLHNRISGLAYFRQRLDEGDSATVEVDREELFNLTANAVFREVPRADG